MNNLINVVNNLLQCSDAHCQQCCAALCQQLLSTTIVHSCSRSTTIVQLLTTSNKLFSSTIVSSCSNNIVTTNCSLSTSNNYWSNITQQHCQFNKCCWTGITTLFRRCSTNNVASTWSIFACVYVKVRTARTWFTEKRGSASCSWYLHKVSASIYYCWFLCFPLSLIL